MMMIFEYHLFLSLFVEMVVSLNHQQLRVMMGYFDERVEYLSSLPWEVVVGTWFELHDVSEHYPKQYENPVGFVESLDDSNIF